MCLEMESGRLYSMVHPDTEAELTNSSPNHPLALVKLNLSSIFAQLLGTFLGHQDFSLRTGSILAILSAPSILFSASNQLLPQILLTCCWLPLPLQLIPVCTEVWVRALPLKDETTNLLSTSAYPMPWSMGTSTTFYMVWYCLSAHTSVLVWLLSPLHLEMKIIREVVF